MVNDVNLLKTINLLKERMNRINRAYKDAFFYCCIMSAFCFLVQLIGNSLKISIIALKWHTEIPESWRMYSPDKLLFISPVVSLILGFFSFRLRIKLIKLFQLITNIIFIAICIYVMCLGVSSDLLPIAIVLAAVMLLLTIRCMIVDKDDRRLSHIEGYPHFNPLVMEDIKRDENIKLEYKDRKTYEEINRERDKDYLENNPDCETIKIINKEKKAEIKNKTGDWLDDMLNEGEKMQRSVSEITDTRKRNNKNKSEEDWLDEILGKNNKKY